jgi:hypothetical protein
MATHQARLSSLLVEIRLTVHQPGAIKDEAKSSERELQRLERDSDLFDQLVNVIRETSPARVTPLVSLIRNADSRENLGARLTDHSKKKA